MKKIITIIGARPQIIKSAALSRIIKTKFSDEIKEIIVHTGQHYDADMSQVFFDELELSSPQYNLNIGSSSQTRQTAEMMKGLENVFNEEKPNAIVVYGDTNSTLSAAIVASKMNFPVVHIEAGLRSYDKTMPEEINRIMCDHVSTLLFSPTKTGVENLKNEGFNIENSAPYSINHPKVYHCGDIMYDNSKYFSKKSVLAIPPYDLMALQSQNFFLATFHRQENTDNRERLKAIVKSLLAITTLYPNNIIYLPLHPRTKISIEQNLPDNLKKELEENKQLKIIPPVTYLMMINFLKNCELVITDSGGLQKEAYFFKKPSVILRPNTEWTEIIKQGVGILTNTEKHSILDGVNMMLQLKNADFPPLYGDGNAAEFIVKKIIKHC